jgi:sugar O-acyltransferase (sialic acid O-acetyltransferase NeuD family)
MKNETYYITGCSGYSEEIAFALNRFHNNNTNIFFIENDSKFINTDSPLGIKILNEEILKDTKSPNVFVTITNPQIRESIVNKYRKFNADVIFPNFLDSSLIIDLNSSVMGVGNIILHNTVITTNVKLGDFNIINCYTGVGHDTKIGDFNTFNPRVSISGNVSIGNKNTFGMNSGILQNKSIIDDNNIWINSTITKNYKSGYTFFGVPAKKILI